MRWLYRKFDEVFAEQGTTALRRIGLALVFGSIIGFVVLLRNQRHAHLAAKELALFSAGIGVAAMLTTALLQFGNALWKRGIIAKFFAIIFTVLGTFFLLGLILNGIILVAGK